VEGRSCRAGKPDTKDVWDKGAEPGGDKEKKGKTRGQGNAEMRDKIAGESKG